MSSSKLEMSIIKVLRVGVIISSIIIIIGLIMLFTTGNDSFDTNNISFSIVLFNALEFKPAYIIMVGLLVLILTPILRIVASLFIFKLQKDKTYVYVTLIILTILTISFIIGFTI